MNQRGVYILKGTRYYVGSTNDLKRRLGEHKRGKTITTAKLGEFELVRWLECENEEEARTLEIKIKKGGHYERWII